MAKRFHRKLLLAALETTYGVDALPDGGSNAILTSQLAVRLLQGTPIRRSLDRRVIGNEPVLHVAPYVQCSFSVELAHPGPTGTRVFPPGYDPLLRACGLRSTEGAYNLTYLPRKTGFESATLYFYVDDVLHVMLGARGTVQFSLSPNELPRMNFTFTGLRVDPTDTALPAAILTAFTTPLGVTCATTILFLAGESVVAEKVELDLGNQIEYRNVIGDESVLLIDRQPTGVVQVEERILSERDWHFLASRDTDFALVYTHGLDSATIVLTAPCAQIESMEYQNSRGVLLTGLNLLLLPTWNTATGGSGEGYDDSVDADELSLTFNWNSGETGPPPPP